MSYSDFTIDDLKTKLGLTLVQDEELFPPLLTHPVSDETKNYIRRHTPLALAIDTEKARSEYILAPLLGELHLAYHTQLSLFSGIDFTVDKEAGLSGRCDFLIARSGDHFSLTAPVVVLVEAKNDSIKAGIPQCGAEMVGAQRYNLQKNAPIDIVYGCISTGSIWRFLKLVDQTLFIDTREYYLDALEEIMGILAHVSLP